MKDTKYPYAKLEPQLFSSLSARGSQACPLIQDNIILGHDSPVAHRNSNIRPCIKSRKLL